MYSNTREACLHHFPELVCGVIIEAMVDKDRATRTAARSHFFYDSCERSLFATNLMEDVDLAFVARVANHADVEHFSDAGNRHINASVFRQIAKRFQ